MTLVAHLTELRNRVAKALLALLVATAVAFWWYDHGLGEFIRAPYCGLDPHLRFGGENSGCGLLITDVFGGVFIRLKVAFLAGAVLSPRSGCTSCGPSSPRASSATRSGTGSGSSPSRPCSSPPAPCSPTSRCPRAWRCCSPSPVTGWSSPSPRRTTSGSCSPCWSRSGVSFEVPLIAVALNLVGVLPYEVLAKSRRWIFFRPSCSPRSSRPRQDPFTMLVMAGPMIALFEGPSRSPGWSTSDGRGGRTTERFHDLADDEASPLDAAPSSLDERATPPP